MENKSLAPSIARLTAIAFMVFVAMALVRPIFTDSLLPLVWPFMIAIMSAVLLYFVRLRNDVGAQIMRVGFYIGMMAFFLSFPILSPDDINSDITADVHNLLGWALLLTVAGFEAMYWILPVSQSSNQPVNGSLEITDKQRHWLLAFMFIGILSWFVSVWDYANAIDAPITSVILSMRGVIEGGKRDAVSNPGYLTLALGTGIFLSATAASFLLTAGRLPIRSALFCWSAVLGCAGIGFLNGSRAIFLYSVVPLAVAVWRVISRSRFKTLFRFAGVASALTLVLIIWGAMAAMRGADIRNFEGGIDRISPTTQIQGAFDIYSTTANVFETFPEKIPYAYGESLIPLVLGWVPRTIWPDKPYPFGVFMNVINGETIEVRTASFAVGLTGEGYGNFGFGGAFLWGGLLGLACRRGDRYLATLHSGHPLRLQLAGMAAIWVAMIVRGGVPEMFYMGLQVIILPLLLAKFFALMHEKFERQRTDLQGLGVIDPSYF